MIVVKSNKKDSRKHISSRRHVRKIVGLLLNGSGDLVTNDTAKTKVLNTFFTFGFQQTQAPETKGKHHFSPEQGQLRKHLERTDRHKSMGPSGMDPPRRELAVSLQGHSRLSLKCHVDWGISVRTERKQMTLLF